MKFNYYLNFKMPNNIIKSIHEQTGIKANKLESEYKKLEKEAEKNKATNKFAYATAIIEKMHKYNSKDKK